MPKTKKLSKEMEKVFDPKHAREISKGHDLKVTLKKGVKGTSLFAKKPIKKGSVIAYYKFLVHKQDTFYGVKNNMYAMSVYTKNENLSNNLIGDIYEGSLEAPRYGIPFWGYFSNEPSGKQKENAYLDINTKGNYKNRDRVKPGDTLVFKIVALHDIKTNEEITWCYGGAYGRNYKPNCDD